MRTGVDLWRAGVAPRIVFSGAHPGDGLRNETEANAMFQYALTLVDHAPADGMCVCRRAPAGGPLAIGFLSGGLECCLQRTKSFAANA